MSQVSVIARDRLHVYVHGIRCACLQHWPFAGVTERRVELVRRGQIPRGTLPEPKAPDAYKQLKPGKNVLSRRGLNCLSWNGCHGRLQVGVRHNLHREREDEQGQVYERGEGGQGMNRSSPR